MLSNITKIAIKVAITRNGNPIAKVSGLIPKGCINAGIPAIRRRLKVFDPRTLPTAIPWFPRRNAATEVRISGRDVPKATTVMVSTEDPTFKSSDRVKILSMR